MKKISFIKQYLRHPKSVGAILPSSKYLANKMVEGIDFKNASCIIEYGPGTGVFTEKLLSRRRDNTIILLMELNDKFYNMLKAKFKNKENLFVINDSSENIDIYLNKYNIKSVDYIVSGLPFASLPEKISRNILNKTREVLKEDGNFITFQYTLFKKEFIKQYFKQINIKRELRNIPPAYVFNCINCK